MEAHTTCSSALLKGITQKLSERTGRQKRFISSVCEIENLFVSRLGQTNRSLTEKYRFGNLEEEHLSTIKAIYEDRNLECLTGDRAHEFFRRLEKYNAASDQELSS